MIQFVDDMMIVNLKITLLWWKANWGLVLAGFGLLIADYVVWRRTHKIVRIPCRKRY